MKGARDIRRNFPRSTPPVGGARPDGQVLLAQRPPGKAYAGYWEFPGGKLEPGESPRAALDRELHEELGLVVRRAAPWLVRRYTYPHAQVELHFFRVFAFDGEPVGHDGHAFAWQRPGQFTVGPLLPANAPMLRALELPAIYGITRASDMGEARFLASARRALEGGCGSCRSAKCRGRGSASARWRERPPDLLCAASCHTAAAIERAGALGLDFAVLGPVRATPTHPGATPLGWPGIADAVAATTLPVFALGGLVADDAGAAIAHGAHGVALRRGAWPDEPRLGVV